MRRALPHLTALLCGVAAALAMGCGSRSHLLPPADATAIKDQLAQVRQAVDAGDCAGAQDALNRARAAALDLPSNVDRRLRARINEGIKQLRTDVPADCAAPAQQPTTTEAPASTPTPSTTTTTTDTTTTTVPSETTPAPPADTTTQPAPPADTTTQPTDTVPSDTGGASPGAPQP